MFAYSMMSLINKPAPVTKNTLTAIDRIFVNSFTTTNLKTGIIKSDVLDYFLILFVGRLQYSYKRNIPYLGATFLKFLLKNSNTNCTVSWDSITCSSDKNKAYDNFIEIFSSHYGECFPKKKIKLKPQKNNNPWITKETKKIVQKKTEIVRKILKKQKWKNEKLYRSYKSLFESVKCKPKMIYCSRKTLEFKTTQRRHERTNR